MSEWLAESYRMEFVTSVAHDTLEDSRERGEECNLTLVRITPLESPNAEAYEVVPLLSEEFVKDAIDRVSDRNTQLLLEATVLDNEAALQKLSEVARSKYDAYKQGTAWPVFVTYLDQFTATFVTIG